MKLSHLIDDIVDLTEECGILAATSEPTPGGLLLSPVEFDLYETHADALDLSFTSPFKVLEFLGKKLGYKRIKEGEKVIAHYRPHESSPLVAYFDGFRGEVMGTDEIGRPWVKFRDQDWEHAVSSSKIKSRDGVSPLETGDENIQPRLLTIRLDPLDVQSYRKQLARMGYIYPRANLLSKNWMHILPKSPQPPLNIYDDEPVPEEYVEIPEGKEETKDKGEEKKGYFYDPLVTDLVSMSHEQVRYILDNAEEFLLDLKDDPDYIPEGDKPNFIDWNPPTGHSTGALKSLVEILPELEVAAKALVPSANYPLSGIEGDKAKKVWKELMSSESFQKSLKKRPPGAQWALAHYVYTLKALGNKVKPFSYWTSEHEKKFQERHQRIQKSMKHKHDFMNKHNGETPEHYRNRTGKCPRGFTFIEERKRCIHT